ncbi:hypothetical protein Tco_1149851 [Tanacetum coccineum]
MLVGVTTQGCPSGKRACDYHSKMCEVSSSASWHKEPKFLIKMSSKRSEDEELEYPFFEGDGSSSDEWGDYDVAGDDYEGPPIFDDDQFDDDYEGHPVFDDYPYEEEIVSGDVGK